MQWHTCMHLKGGTANAFEVQKVEKFCYSLRQRHDSFATVVKFNYKREHRENHGKTGNG